MRYGGAPGAQAHWRCFERPKRPHIRRTEWCRRPALTTSWTGRTLHAFTFAWKKKLLCAVGVPLCASGQLKIIVTRCRSAFMCIWQAFACCCWRECKHETLLLLPCIKEEPSLSPRSPQRMCNCAAAPVPALTSCSRVCPLERFRQAHAGSSALPCLLMFLNTAAAAAFAIHKDCATRQNRFSSSNKTRRAEPPAGESCSVW